MIALNTGKSKVRIEGDRIIAAFASGKSVIEIAMTLNEALELSHTLHGVTIDALRTGFAAPLDAELVAYQAREGRHHA